MSINITLAGIATEEQKNILLSSCELAFEKAERALESSTLMEPAQIVAILNTFIPILTEAVDNFADDFDILQRLSVFMDKISSELLYYLSTLSETGAQIALGPCGFDEKVEASDLSSSIHQAVTILFGLRDSLRELDSTCEQQKNKLTSSRKQISTKSSAEALAKYGQPEASIMNSVVFRVLVVLTFVAGSALVVASLRSRLYTDGVIECADDAFKSIGSEGNECTDLHSESEGLCIDMPRILSRCLD